MSRTKGILIAMAGILFAGMTFADDADYGEPGFRMFTFTGSAYNGTSSLWGSGNVLRTVFPDKLYVAQGSSMPEYTTYAYGTYMFMEANVIYAFYACYDDYATVKIDDVVVIGRANFKCANQSGSISFATDGWHRLELRVSNESGNGGALDSVGIMYSTSKDATKRPMTDYGTGALFRVGPELATFTEYTGCDASGAGMFVRSIKMRENDPTIMDVEYYGYGTTNKVDVRMLAFKDGVRSFANVLRPETFVDDTGTNLGDNVSISGMRKVSWKVSSDWDIDLAKVSVEFLVKPTPDLIPMRFVTIPAAGTNKAMKVSTTIPSFNSVYNALLWLYADGYEGLTLQDGELKYNGCLLAKDFAIVVSARFLGLAIWNVELITSGGSGGFYNNKAMTALEFLYNVMGYGRLDGAELSYAESATRRVFSPDQSYGRGLSGYAYKWLEDGE